MLTKILYVEDDPVTQMLCKIIIGKSEFSQAVDTCQDGQLAVEYFKTLRASGSPLPELVFLDLNMPVMGGWEFLQVYQSEFATLYPDLKIVVLSSSIDPDDEQRASQHPLVIDFIAKPLRFEHLVRLKGHDTLKPYF